MQRTSTPKAISAPREPVLVTVKSMISITRPAVALNSPDLALRDRSSHTESPSSSAWAISLGLLNFPCVRKSRPLFGIPKTLEIIVKTKSADVSVLNNLNH